MIPVQAKGKRDNVGIPQVLQDTHFVQEKFPGISYHLIAVQSMADKLIAMFDLKLLDDGIKVVKEHHYQLVPWEDMESKRSETGKIGRL